MTSKILPWEFFAEQAKPALTKMSVLVATMREYYNQTIKLLKEDKMRGIKGRVVFVTGGENGLGAAISKKFAEEGAKVVIFGIDEARGLKVAEEINSITEGAMFIRGNVMNLEDIQKAMGTIKEKYGTLDFAVNNAGITGALNPFIKTPAEQFDSIMGVNVKGMFLCMQQELEMMVAKQFGRIVNVSSEAGFKGGFKGLSVYTASKHAVNGLTKTAAIEHATDGININAVAPGTMLTPLVEAFPQEDQDALAALRPSNRLVNVESVANTVVYMCSDDAKDMVGTFISIDGGSAVQ